MNKLLGAAVAALTISIALPAAADHKTGHADPFAKRNAERAASTRLAEQQRVMPMTMTMAEGGAMSMAHRAAMKPSDKMGPHACCPGGMKPKPKTAS